MNIHNFLTKQKDVFFNLIRAISSSLVLVRIKLKGVLSNQYLLNTEQDDLDLIDYSDYPIFYPHSYGIYLDYIGNQFDVYRFPNEDDEKFRQRILFSITKNPTKNGLKETVYFLLQTNNTGLYRVPNQEDLGYSEPKYYDIKQVFDVEVNESFDNFFDGVTSTFDDPFRSYKETLYFGVEIIIKPKNLRLSKVLSYSDYTNLFSENKISYRYRNPSMHDTLTLINEKDNQGNNVKDENNNDVEIYQPKVGKTQEDVRNTVIERDDAAFHKYANPEPSYLSSIYNESNLTKVLSQSLASGIKLERVLILSPSTKNMNGV